MQVTQGLSLNLETWTPELAAFLIPPPSLEWAANLTKVTRQTHTYNMVVLTKLFCYQFIISE